MRKHWKLFLMLPLATIMANTALSDTAASADTEAACAAFSQATALVNTDLTPFLGFARKEGWSYNDAGMSDAIQKASTGLAQAGHDVDAKLVETEPGPAQNALRHYSATATELGQKIARRAAFADLTSTVEAYNAAVHTANGACGLGIGG